MASLQRSDVVALARRRLLEAGQAPADLIGSVLADSWQRSLAAGLDPLAVVAELPHATSAELARALDVTRRTTSQAATALKKADLAALRPGDHALVPRTAPRAS